MVKIYAGIACKCLLDLLMPNKTQYMHVYVIIHFGQKRCVTKLTAPVFDHKLLLTHNKIKTCAEGSSTNIAERYRPFSSYKQTQ